MPRRSSWVGNGMDPARGFQRASEFEERAASAPEPCSNGPEKGGTEYPSGVTHKSAGSSGFAGRGGGAVDTTKWAKHSTSTASTEPGGAAR